MDTARLFKAIIKVLNKILVELQGGLKWRRVKKLIRDYIWRPYIRPSIANQDFGWVDEALLLLALIGVLVNQWIKAPASLKKSAMSHAEMLKTLVQ
jgi:hypothetical protein